MANKPLEMRLMTTDAQTQQLLDTLAWFDELKAKMLFTPLISAEEMRRMQSNDAWKRAAKAGGSDDR